jgi:hypothetical protein
MDIKSIGKIAIVFLQRINSNPFDPLELVFLDAFAAGFVALRHALHFGIDDAELQKVGDAGILILIGQMSTVYSIRNRVAFQALSSERVLEKGPLVRIYVDASVNSFWMDENGFSFLPGLPRFPGHDRRGDVNLVQGRE